MLPLILLKSAKDSPLMVELKSGETYNGCLITCDSWMNISLKNVVYTSKDGDEFLKMSECFIRGSMIKYLSIPDEIFDSAMEESKQQMESEANVFSTNRGRRGLHAYRGRGNYHNTYHRNANHRNANHRNANHRNANHRSYGYQQNTRGHRGRGQ